MKQLRFTRLVLLTALFGCLLIGCATPPLSGSGGTVDLISQSQNHVTFVYTHHYARELPYASQAAEQHCQRYGKHAQLVQNTPNGPDRTTVSFTCI
jgi:hypothetical protein